MRAVHPLRALTAKATSERVDVVQRTRALLEVHAGHPYTQAAHAAGYKSGDSVSLLVERFNQRGLASLRIAAACEDILSLIIAYYRGDPGPHVAIQQVCLGTSERLPLNRGIVEDAAYYARYRQIVAESRG